MSKIDEQRILKDIDTSLLKSGASLVTLLETIIQKLEEMEIRIEKLEKKEVRK